MKIHVPAMRFFTLLVLAIPNIIYANPVPQNSDDLIINPDPSLEEEAPNVALLDDSSTFYEAGCPKDSSSRNLSDDNTNDVQNVIYRRSVTYCPSTGYQLPPTPGHQRNIPLQPKTNQWVNPSDRTQSGSSSGLCSKYFLPEHVSCAGPEVLNNQNGKLDLVLDCVHGKSRSQPRPITSK